MADDITARARMPGARKSIGSGVSLGRTSTSEKNTKSKIGMTRVSSNCSPLRSVVVTSWRTCAASGLGRLTTRPHQWSNG